MIGYRAFGKNEGSLGHAGDFDMLFRPLLDRLSSLAVYGLEPSDGLAFPFYWESDDVDEADKMLEELFASLDSLDMCPHPRLDTRVMWPRYYRPGFFPKFSKFIKDDWNDLACYAEPFPDYDLLLKAEHVRNPEARQAQDPQIQRQNWLATGFKFHFRNIDACWWEVFSPDAEAMQQLHDYFTAERIDFQELSFERDFPESSTPVDREFRGVHYLRSSEEGQQPPEREK